MCQKYIGIAVGFKGQKCSKIYYGLGCLLNNITILHIAIGVYMLKSSSLLRSKIYTCTPARPFSVGLHCAPFTTAPGGTEPTGGPLMLGFPPYPSAFAFTQAVNESDCLEAVKSAAKYFVSFAGSPVGLCVDRGSCASCGAEPLGPYSAGPGMGYGETFLQMSK